jgi:hypothetical protein
MKATCGSVRLPVYVRSIINLHDEAMDLLISSKLCVTSHRITIEFLPECASSVKVTAVIVSGDHSGTGRTVRRTSRRYSSQAPLAIDPQAPSPGPFAAESFIGHWQVDVDTPYGLRRDYRLDGETLYSQYLPRSAA